MSWSPIWAFPKIFTDEIKQDLVNASYYDVESDSAREQVLLSPFFVHGEGRDIVLLPICTVVRLSSFGGGCFKDHS